MANDASRHAPLSAVESYFAKNLRGGFGIAGSPEVRLMVDPIGKVLSLRTAAQGREPAIAEYQRVKFESHLEGTAVVHQFEVIVDTNLEEVYALLCSVADRLQLSGEDFASAVEAAMESMASIVETRTVLTTERQVGLFGELLTLLALSVAAGPSAAIEGWRGPRGEEHDFGTPSADVEVKSTLGERRTHWISTDTQLVATPNRELYVLSIQLTTAAPKSGWTLPELVGVVRTGLSSERAAFDALLARSSYRDKDADLYVSRWGLRSAPAFFAVSDDFPAVTHARLKETIPNAELVIEIRYRLDLTDRTQATQLFSFDGLEKVGTDT